MPILGHLAQGFLTGIGVSSEYTSPDSLGSDDNIKADMIDEMARKHWPLCMRHLHDSLRSDRHLKHYGRLQYGLFLKVRYSVFDIEQCDCNAITGCGIIDRRSDNFLAEGVWGDAYG